MVSTVLTYLFASLVITTADQAVSMGSMEPATGADFTVTPVSCVVPDQAKKTQAYIDATAHRLDIRMKNAIKGIDDIGKRLLALKYYLKRQGSIRRSWTWTRAEAMRYKKSKDYTRSIAELMVLRKTFEEMNPGYSVRANTDIRGVGDQVDLWNETSSVEASSDALLEKTVRELSDSTWPDTPNRSSLKRFRSFLAKANIPMVPTVAVPGFSQHGQLRAFDIVIVSGRQIVAGTDAGSVRSVWDQAGWTKRLQEAIDSSKVHFSGPLRSPYEPWHYEFVR